MNQAEPRWKAGWEDQETNALESSLAATPLQRLEWLEEALELAAAAGSAPSGDRSQPEEAAARGARHRVPADPSGSVAAPPSGSERFERASVTLAP